MLDDILFIEGDREEMVLELPPGDALEPPADILASEAMEYEVPPVVREYSGVFV